MNRQGEGNAQLAQAVEKQLSGDLSGAEHLYEQLIANASGADAASAHHNLGLLRLQAGRMDEGVEHLRQALIALPNEPQYWVSFTKALIGGGREDLARQMLAQGQAQGLSGGEVAMLAAKLGVRRSVPEECVRLVDTLVRADQSALAEGVARELTQQHARFSAGWNALGATLRAQGRYDDAVTAFEAAARLSGPASADIQLNIGVTLMEQGRLPEAHARLTEALERDPTELGRYFLANCEVLMGRLDDALSRYQQAVTADPGFFEAWFNLGQTHVRQSRLEDAHAALLHAEQLRPDHPDVQFALAELELLLTQPKEAQARVDTAARLAPNDARLERLTERIRAAQT